MKCKFLLFLFVVFLSCKKENEERPIEIVIPVDTTIAVSRLTQLEYPKGTGTSGDIVTGVLGYGYDINGFSDTTSVKEKVLDVDINNIYIDQLRSGIPSLIIRDNFTNLMEDLWESTYYKQSILSLSSHIKSLWKLAYKTDSISANYAFTYYSFSWISPRYRIGPSLDYQALLSTKFKNDIILLSPKELISKYGTHVLTHVMLGKKIEVLYGIKSTKNNSPTATQVEKCFFKRMNQFFGGTPGIGFIAGSEPDYVSNDELLIYNTIGCNTKLCGVLKPTDNNADKIVIDAFSSFNLSEKLQLIHVDDNGLLLLSDLISDPTKRQEIKNYIDDYMMAGMSMHVW